MNKKTVLLVIVLLAIFLLLFMLFRGIGGGNSTTTPKANSTEIESRVNWQQKQMSVSFFSTNEYQNGGQVEDIKDIHIGFTSFFNISVAGEQKMTDLSVTVVKFAQGIGKQILYKTPHNKVSTSRSYIYEPMETETHTKDLVDGGKTLKFAVVNSSPAYYDEVLNQAALPQFMMFSKSLGTISYKTILNRDNVFEGSKLLKYAGVTAEQLNGEIVLDFTITFEDGKKYIKRLSGTIDGSKILNDTFYTIEFQEVE